MSEKETKAQTLVMNEYVKARNIVQKSYNYLNGRSIGQAIDDWTKRWNGYISEPSPLLDSDQSRMFLNFTRNQIIAYVSSIAMMRPQTKVQAVNKKTGSIDRQFADVMNDLLNYSADEENGDQKFLSAALECTTKGTVIVYEGYMKNVQKMDVPTDFNAQLGEILYKKQYRTIFDNCFQRIVPIEDFFIANPYQPDVQKQPFVIWREITTYDEAEMEFGDYSNWKYVVKGMYTLANDVDTFYRNSLVTELQGEQVEIIRFYRKHDNKHILMINGIVIYTGPIPFKDGNYPFAKGIFEPYGNDFFWGAGFPQKIMGEQDLMNTFWNMMVDKTHGSLLPFGLSSDLDDWVEDDTLSLNRIRKVGDINKWKFDTLPGVSAGEQSMLQTALSFARENSGVTGGADAMTPRGGKLSVRQVLLQQQESMKKMGFPMALLEDFEQARCKLRLDHILQFYSIPKIEKIAGKSGKEIEKLVYRDVKLNSVELSDGVKGGRIIKLIAKPKNQDERQKIADDLSVVEAIGEETGNPTEALAISVDTFYDYNFSVQVIKASSYQKNAALDQAARMEYANWRLPLIQVAPADPTKIVDWVGESFDIDQEQFAPAPQPPQTPGAPEQMQGMSQPQQSQQSQQPAKPTLPQIQPSSMKTLANTMQ